MVAKIYNGNKGTSSEYFTVSIYDNAGEFVRATGKYWNTERGAKNWAIKHGYTVEK